MAGFKMFPGLAFLGKVWAQYVLGVCHWGMASRANLPLVATKPPSAARGSP